MKLSLKNFRQHKSLDLEFPDKGLVLIKGVSGAGKSSILDAIFDSFYGEATKVKPWDGGATEEHLQFMNYELFRKRTPNSFRAIIGGVELHDESAEEAIVKIVNNSREFMASSYIKQRMQGSLLTLPPAEQLRFIQKLAFGDQDPETIREKINAYATTIEKDLAKAQALKDAAERDLAEAQAAIVELPEAGPDPSEAYKAASETVNQAKAALTAARANYDATSRKLTSKEWAELDSHNATMAAIKTSLAEQKVKHTSLADTLSKAAVPYAEQLKANAKAHQALLSNYNIYLAAKKRGKELAESSKAFGYQKGKLVDFLFVARSAASETLSTSQNEATRRKETIRDMERESDAQACPACAAPLVVKAGKVVAHSHSAESMAALKTALTAERAALEAAEAKVTAASTTLKALEKLAAEAQSVKAAMGDTKPIEGIDTAEALAAEMDKVSEYLQTQAVLEKTRIGLETQFAELAQAMLSNETKYNVLHIKAKHLEERLGSKEDLHIQLNKLGGVLAEHEKALHDAETAHATQRKAKDAYDAHMAARAVQKERQAAVTRIKAKLTEHTTSVEGLLKKLGSATKLKELSDHAAVAAIEGIVESINENAKLHIDAMFPDTGTSIRLQNVSVTKKGDERAKMSTAIVHKGHDAGKDTEILSGGEQNRATLAFQLGLGDLYNSPLLLIDEGFAGLSETDLEIALEHVKTISSERLIIVVEHRVPEHFFDQVIEIGA